MVVGMVQDTLGSMLGVCGWKSGSDHTDLVTEVEVNSVFSVRQRKILAESVYDVSDQRDAT